MGDWEFLYDMKNEGYSEEDIMDAQTSGATPQEWVEITKQEKKRKTKMPIVHQVQKLKRPISF